MTIERPEWILRTHAWIGGAPLCRDGWLVAALALAVRLVVVAWAAPRFPPAEDGGFYHVIAGRIAAGLGYTWLWPDGSVTYAAHYPVGYPAMLGALYFAVGQDVVFAMGLNALVGSAAVLAVHRVSASVSSRGGALLAALAVALHPALVGYTPALMTEGIVAALVAVAALVVVSARRGRGSHASLFGLGVLFGIATLVRPQTILLAPCFGALVPLSGMRRRAISAALTTIVAVAVCTPWMIRNCARMERCVFVSANGGWNLLIGAGKHATGTWLPITEVGFPENCRNVFGEAEKDECFRLAAFERVVDQPERWLLLIPRKLAATFDYCGAAGWYLSASGPTHFDKDDRFALGVLETVWQRLLLFVSIVALARVPWGARKTRMVLLLLAGIWVFQRSGWIAYLGVGFAGMTLGRMTTRHPPAVLAAATVLMTALTHAVFFGAGRYSMVCFPLLAALAGASLTRGQPTGDTPVRSG